MAVVTGEAGEEGELDPEEKDPNDPDPDCCCSEARFDDSLFSSDVRRVLFYKYTGEKFG